MDFTSIGSIVLIGVMLIALYFFMIRPQKKQEKQQNAMRNSLQVGDEITTIGGIIGKVVSIKEETVTIEIEVADVTAEYSVAQYKTDLPEDNEAYAIVAELMDYCEAARIYFANEDATETEDLTADLTDYKATVEGEEEGATIPGATLVLESKTTINVYVTAENLDDVACTVDEEEVTPVAVEGQAGQYVISISDIVSKDLDKTYTITIGGYTITYSALSYVETTLAGDNNSVALENLVKALYSLSVEAEEYFQ